MINWKGALIGLFIFILLWLVCFFIAFIIAFGNPFPGSGAILDMLDLFFLPLPIHSGVFPRRSSSGQCVSVRRTDAGTMQEEIGGVAGIRYRVRSVLQSKEYQDTFSERG